MAYTKPDLEAYSALEQSNIRKVSPDVLIEVLSKGWDDFKAMPTFAFFLVVIYPILGVIIFSVTFQYNSLPLVFPLIAGFTLLGPLAAVGLYEMSRWREKNLTISSSLLNFLRSPAMRSILILGLILMAIFIAWLVTAQLVYNAIFGASGLPSTIEGFVEQVLTTSRGWTLIVVGCGLGFVFALVTFAISVVSFPMILDRNVSVPVAVVTSVKVVVTNPRTMAIWGLIIAGALFVGSLPFFVGLIVVLPVLGHSTWHLYRKIVER